MGRYDSGLHTGFWDPLKMGTTKLNDHSWGEEPERKHELKCWRMRSRNSWEDHLIQSDLTPSGPGALPNLSRAIAFLSSSIVIGCRGTGAGSGKIGD